MATAGDEYVRRVQMGWLSKIFKGSSYNVSEGHYSGYGQDQISDGASTSEDPSMLNEDEDIDRAIALSLLEEEQKKKQVIG